MPIQPINFAQLQPQGNPYYRNLMSSVTQGPSALADMVSKIAYARYAPIMPIAQILSNPNIGALMQPEQVKGLADVLQRTLNQSNSGSPFSGLLGNMLGGANTSGGSSNAFTPSSPSPSPTTGYDGNNTGGGYPQGSNTIDSGKLTSPEENPPTVKSAGYATGGSTEAGQLGIPGAMGGLTPFSGAEAQKEALKTTATSQAQAATEQWKQLQEHAAHDAELGQNLINQANAFHSSYKKSHLKGPVLGNLDPNSWSGRIVKDIFGTVGPDQDMRNASSNAQVAMANAIDHGRLTNMIAGLGGLLKFSPAYDDVSEGHQTGSAKAVGKRMVDNQLLLTELQRNNPDILPQEGTALLRLYNRNSPAFDFSNKAPIDENNTDKIRHLYASPKALAELRRTGEFNPGNSEQNNTTSSSVANILRNSPSAQNEGLARVDLSGSGRNIANDRTIQFPTFNSKQEMLNWYNQQTEPVQQAFRRRLGG